MSHHVIFSAHRALLAIVVAGAAGGLAVAGPWAGRALAEEPQRTPFQAMPPVLTTPAQVSASVPYEAEIVEGDPEQQNRRARRTDWLEDVDPLETVERFDAFEAPRGPERVERQEPVERPVGLVRPERVERPEKVERPDKVERPQKLERPERAQRPGRLERVGRIDRPR